MKVLFITHYIYMMGANRSMLRLMLELRELGVEPVVLMPSHRINSKGTPDTGRTLVDYLDEHGIRYIPAPFRMAKMDSRLLSTAAYFYNRLTYPSILRKVRPLGIDLIHSNSGATDLGAWLSRKLGVPHVWHLREYGDLDYGLKSPFGNFYDRLYFKGNHHFIAISKSILSHYTSLIPASRLSLIYNGVNPPEHSRVKELSHDTRQVNICVVGYITPLKGQLDAVKAIKRLVDQSHATPFHLYIAGRGEPDAIKQIEHYVSSHDLDSVVTLTGQLE
ncbi:MAG: glycosyltransferase, partial [Duncaniella sp.]|nr:glycosyltransferase [Duncaniella sp.]